MTGWEDPAMGTRAVDTSPIGIREGLGTMGGGIRSS